MSENQDLLEQLKKLQSYKKSRAFYAEKLGISVEEVVELMAELKGKPVKQEDYIEACEELIEEFDERIDPYKRPYYWLTGVFENYDKYLTKSRKHVKYTKDNFSVEVMERKLIEILDGLPNKKPQLSLKLPQLTKLI